MEHVGKLGFNLIAREASSFVNLEKEATNLTQQIELLKPKRDDILSELEVEESANRGKKRKREVEHWLNLVNEKIGESEQLIQDAENCAVTSRRGLSKQIVHKAREITELVDQSKCFQGLMLDRLEPEKVPLVTTTSTARGNAFQHNLENIWSLVMDDTVSSIGIHGMGGVGKTTLAMRVHDDLLREPKFGNRVYFVTASQECTIHKLQNDIAKAMNISIPAGENDELKRAAILYGAMKNKQDYVLILDDLWAGFDETKIGIPSEGRKLLVTSRSEQFCRMMGCKKVIKVEVLSEPEAWELFQEKNENVELHLEVTEVVKKVAERCGGLPLGIITMARSMRGVTDICDWRNALAELKECSNGLNNIEDEVFPVLLYSFKHLKNKIVQNCFLYCSLYPEDFGIQRDELVRRFILEGLIDQGRSRREEINRCHATLNYLEKVCLLVAVTDWRGDKCVKMHDLVRDMALRITRENHPHWRFMVKSGVQLEEIPSEDKWTQDLNMVSLMHNDISTISVGMSPNCPSLRSLNLSYNYSLVSISDSLFENIPSLQTLDLSRTGIETLPGSISRLLNLKGLLLGNCTQLVSLPSLENLKALRELDLTDTDKFRDEIGGLESLTRNLKCLKLAGSSMKMIPYGTLKRLSCLQCLTLPFGDFVGIEALESLTHLEEFGGCFANMDELRQFLKSRNNQSQLISYIIQVGESSHLYYDDDDLHTKFISIINCEREVVIGDDDVLLMRDTKKLTIEFADNAKCLLRVREDREQQCFPPLESLEELELWFLSNLRNIIEVGDLIHPHPATFSHLRKLKIVNCHKMKKVLPRCFVDNLRNLEVLMVEFCEEIEEIIGEEKELGEENNMVGYHTPTSSNHFHTLPNLRKLVLRNLPELKSIWKSNVNCNSIQIIRIFECKKLKKMPLFLSPPPPALQLIKVQREWWDSLEWDHPHHKDRLQPFVTFD